VVVSVAEATPELWLLVLWAPEALVEVAAVASAAALRASTVDVAEVASEEDSAAVEEDSETAAETSAVVATEAAIEVVIEVALAHLAMPRPDLDLIAETEAMVTVATAVIVVTVVTAATEGATEALVGMIREVVVAHMTTDRAAAIVMVVDSAENARTDVPEATWNPSADEKVGIARGTETTTDLATTMLAASADTKVATRIPESCDATKQCPFWTYGGGLSILSFSH
jgi:hypothetical protein